MGDSAIHVHSRCPAARTLQKHWGKMMSVPLRASVQGGATVRFQCGGAYKTLLEQH